MTQPNLTASASVRSGRWAASLLCAAAIIQAAVGAEPGPPYQRLPELDAMVFGCGPNPTNYRIASRAELTRLLQQWDKNCARIPDAAQRKAKFVRALDKANVDFEREWLVVLEGWYGTGMAKATLDLSATAPDTVTAAVAWHVRPPPVTPDTAVYRFVFKADKSRAAKVAVTVNGRLQAVLSIAEEK